MVFEFMFPNKFHTAYITRIFYKLQMNFLDVLEYFSFCRKFSLACVAGKDFFLPNFLKFYSSLFGMSFSVLSQIETVSEGF